MPSHTSHNKMFFIKLLFLAVFVIAGSSFCNSSYAAGNLSTCQPGTGGTGSDGSNCDSGMSCDLLTTMCVYPWQIPCSGIYHCGIGFTCMTGTTGSGATQVTVGDSSSTGTCQTFTGASVDENALSMVLCNVYLLATGKAGRGVVVIVMGVTGVTFYLGKVSWGTLVAIMMGVAFFFGGPAIIAVLVGRGFTCTVSVSSS